MWTSRTAGGVRIVPSSCRGWISIRVPFSRTNGTVLVSSPCSDVRRFETRGTRTAQFARRGLWSTHPPSKAIDFFDQSNCGTNRGETLIRCCLAFPLALHNKLSIVRSFFFAPQLFVENHLCLSEYRLMGNANQDFLQP